MIKSRKVQRMLADNNIEQGNYTLVLRLKAIIQDLQAKIEEQDDIISHFKRDVKTTKINEMEIQIQHLNDENQRLLLVIDELKHKSRPKEMQTSKKHLNRSSKYELRRPVITEFKCDTKVSDVLKENEYLKKELLGLRVNQSLYQRGKTSLNDRSGLLQQKRLIEFQRMQQKKMDLQEQKLVLLGKIKRLDAKVGQLSLRNEQLEKIHYRHTQIVGQLQ